MNTAETILVIALAAALALFLILAIVIAVMAIRLMKTVTRITAKAEHVMQTAENVGDVFRDAAGKMAILRVVQNVVRTVSNHTKKG